jgi:hypothetical protein
VLEDAVQDEDSGAPGLGGEVVEVNLVMREVALERGVIKREEFRLLQTQYVEAGEESMNILEHVHTFRHLGGGLVDRIPRKRVYVESSNITNRDIDVKPFRVERGGREDTH